ncbi:MAG TPA: hypothetical protein VIC28_09440 [Thermoanaerobaculia bacterium]
MPSLLPQRLWLRRSLLAVLAVFLLAVATRVLPRQRARPATGRAQWIWKAIGRKDHDPTAFYAVRDFDLPAPPARARLLVTADEEYVLTLNGKRIGAGAYEPGALLDVYEVGPLLLPGGNRLVAELRSGRGAGGFLASLQDAATGRQLVVTDERWRTFNRHELGLVRGWLPAGGGEPVLCWGYPPVGRWGRPRPGRTAPLLARGPLLPAAAARPLTLALGSPEKGRPPGSPVLYDWGREVEGRLTLDVRPGKTLGAALLFTGASPPDPLRAEPAGSVLILAGRHDWLDARPRRFRYVLLVGLVRRAAAAVLPAPARPVRAEVMQVFGLAGPPLRTPVEDEVWSKLQRFAGVAGRKEP